MLTHHQAQELVLRTVATEAESLLRTARRHSLCADDAHDAYQRAMEIFVRRARTLDPAQAKKWISVVVKHEAMAVRSARGDVAASAEVDADRCEAVHTPSPEEQAMEIDGMARAAEALRRLKPHELRAMWLRAAGSSYAEICEQTGWSYTKVNKSLAAGRKSFLERYAEIEAGRECERWQPVLSALVDGEATAAQLTDVRPHLRNCPSCRATLRALRESQGSLAAVLPAGLLGLGAKLGAVVARLVPDAASPLTADPATSARGVGLFGAGGLKLAGMLAAGVAATAGAGGGLAAAAHPHGAAAHRTVAAMSPPAALRLASLGPAADDRGPAKVAAVVRLPEVHHLRRAARVRPVPQAEFAPSGAPEEPRPVAAAAAALPRTSRSPQPPETVSGEFAPGP